MIPKKGSVSRTVAASTANFTESSRDGKNTNTSGLFATTAGNMFTADARNQMTNWASGEPAATQRTSNTQQTDGNRVPLLNQTAVQFRSPEDLAGNNDELRDSRASTIN